MDTLSYPQHPLHARADVSVSETKQVYTNAQHKAWKKLYTRQAKILPGLMYGTFLKDAERLGITEDEIPDMKQVSRTLLKKTGWQLVTVPGTAKERTIAGYLATKRFPINTTLRDAENIDYSPEPDLFHDMFGHVPMLLNADMRKYLQLLGERACAADGMGTIKYWARLLFYTAEFGLIKESHETRIYGAALASSYKEARLCLKTKDARRIRFDAHRVMRTKMCHREVQQTYFVVESLEQLLKVAQKSAHSYTQRLKGLPPISYKDVLPEHDIVLM